MKLSRGTERPSDGSHRFLPRMPRKLSTTCRAYRKKLYLCSPFEKWGQTAEVAQSVEHQPSKLRVAGSNLVFRSHQKALEIITLETLRLFLGLYEFAMCYPLAQTEYIFAPINRLRNMPMGAIIYLVLCMNVIVYICAGNSIWGK